MKRVCPKCGNKKLSMKYFCQTDYYEEGIVVTCKRCGYKWENEPIEKDKRKNFEKCNHEYKNGCEGFFERLSNLGSGYYFSPKCIKCGKSKSNAVPSVWP